MEEDEQNPDSSKTSESKTKVTVYHYTDKKGKEAIEETRTIQPSKDGAHGPGVYLTTMPPEEGRKAVSQNNWDGGWEIRESAGRADHAIEIEIPKSKVKDSGSKGRDILIHEGPVKLDDYKWKTMQKEEDDDDDD